MCDIIKYSDGVTYEVKLSLILPSRLNRPEPEPEPLKEININTASLEELLEIIHIGESRAEEIIELRPFVSLDELIRVTGIGPARLEDI